VGDAADGQVAVDAPVLGIDLLDALALEGQVGVGVCVEEIGRAQVAVALGVTRVDAGSLDLHVDAGQSRVGFVEVNCTSELLETAAHGRDHKMTDAEGYF
jgi:hypothetical protein